MPELTPEDDLVLDYVSTWYGTHRGALGAEDVAAAVGLPAAQVAACAGVLAAAGHVRTYPSVRRSDGARDVCFVGMVTTGMITTGRRTVDLRSARTAAPAAPEATAAASLGAAALA